MSITFHADGRVTGNSAGNFGSTGQIIQTVIGANGGGSGSSIAVTSSSASSPMFLDSNCIVTITPKRSDSKILLTWSAQIRLNPSSNGFVGVFYSANSNMSSPSVVEKYRSNNINESYRTPSRSFDPQGQSPLGIEVRHGNHLPPDIDSRG